LNAAERGRPAVFLPIVSIGDAHAVASVCRRGDKGQFDP
jgi:hypothetical protein